MMNMRQNSSHSQKSKYDNCSFLIFNLVVVCPRKMLTLFATERMLKTDFFHVFYINSYLFLLNNNNICKTTYAPSLT